MYLEIDNEAPIETTNDGEVMPIGGRAKTVLCFPAGVGLMEAAVTAREVIPWHVADDKVSGFRSDDADLEYLLNCYFGVRNFRVSRRPPSVIAALTMAMAVFAMTRSQLRYTYGASWMAGMMGSPASTGTGAYAPSTYIGVSSDSGAPLAGDTALVGEVTSGTLSRALATYGYTPGASSYTESKVFISDQTIILYKSALFIAPSGGQPVFGSLLKVGGTPTPRPMNSGDQTGITENVAF